MGAEAATKATAKDMAARRLDGIRILRMEVDSFLATCIQFPILARDSWGLDWGSVEKIQRIFIDYDGWREVKM